MAQTELTFWSWRQEDKAFYQDVIKKFQAKEPGITVKFETYAPENYQTILSTALAAGRGPDVIQVRAYGNLETIATPGYLLALDKQNVPELANFPEAALAAETLRSDGKVYAVPFAMQAQLVVYNKKIFKDNGVNPPKTWDEMMALAQALKAKNITPFANGTATAWQNETIVGGLLSSMLGKEFEDGHRLRQGELHRSALRQRARQAEGHQPVLLAELHRRRLSVLAAALRGRPRGDVRGRFL